MKKVEAFIHIFKLEEVKAALAAVGIEGMTVSEVRGCGREGGHVELYRGSEGVVNFIPKLKIEMLLENHKATQVVEAVRRAARTGHVGDGKVFVSPVDEVVRVRTGERGADAL